MMLTGILNKYMCLIFFSNTLDDISYQNIADETLDAIAELFEDLGESPSSPRDYDVHLSVRSNSLSSGLHFFAQIIWSQTCNKVIIYFSTLLSTLIPVNF